MYTRFFFTIITLIVITSAQAQISIEKLFYAMPGELLWLDKNQRTELFAFYKDKHVDSVSNKLNGYCKIVDYDETGQHLKISTSKKGTMEFMIFTGSNNLPAIGVITTACAPACMSSIRFFTTGWNPADVNFPVIAATDFLKEDLTDEQKKLAAGFLSPLLISYEYNKESGEIIAACNAESFLSKDDWKTLNPLLKSSRLAISVSAGEWKLK